MFPSLSHQSTFNYLENLRVTIGNANYRSLFDLSLSSALAIVIDTSSSMGNEIAQVQQVREDQITGIRGALIKLSMYSANLLQQVHEIIEEALSGGIVPSVYILCPYETSFVVTATQDVDEFLAAVDALTVAGGVENLYHALQGVSRSKSVQHQKHAV